MYVGGHAHHGEDGLAVFADRGIGRADYGLPQCSRRPDRSCDQPNGKTDTIFTNDIMLIRMERTVPLGQKVLELKRFEVIKWDSDVVRAIVACPVYIFN